MSVTCVSYACHVCVICLSRVCHMPVICVSYACHVCVTCPSVAWVDRPFPSPCRVALAMGKGQKKGVPDRGPLGKPIFQKIINQLLNLPGFIPFE